MEKKKAKLTDEVIEHFGGPSKMAKSFGVTTMAISHWRRRGLPADRAIQIMRESKNRFTLEELT